MSCTSCNDNNNLYYNDCTSTPSDMGCLSIVDTQCVEYKGNDLTCIGIASGTRLEGILQTIDQKLCEVVSPGSYGTYNTYSLLNLEGETIETQKEFVESISQGYSTLLAGFDAFTSETYANDQDGIDVAIDAINNPSITTCGTVGVISTDDLTTVLTKYGTSLCDIYTKISLSGVNWDLCTTVTPDPTTIAQGFNTVLGLICSVKSDVDAIPVDLHKVKVSATDTTENYLLEKITSPCITITKYVDGGEEKIQLTHQTTDYVFDEGDFDTTTVSTTDCNIQKLISIKAGVFEPDEITCETIDALYSDAVAGTEPTYLYGNSSGCKKIEKCGLRNWMFGSIANGNYMITVNDGESDPCDKISLTAAPEVTCTTVKAVYDSEVAGTVPDTIHGVVGGSCQNIDSCGLLRLMFGDGTYTNGNYSIKVDLDAVDLCDQITLVAAAVGEGGFEPELPCWNDTWSSMSGTLELSGTTSSAHNWTVDSLGDPMWIGAPPMYSPVMKFNVLGQLITKGSFKVNITDVAGSAGEVRSGTMDIDLAVLTDPCFEGLTQGQVRQATVYILEGSSMSEVIRTQAIASVVMDVPNNSLYLRVQYSTISSASTISFMVSLDGVMFDVGL